jgi:hypothetical protein
MKDWEVRVQLTPVIGATMGSVLAAAPAARPKNGV